MKGVMSSAPALSDGTQASTSIEGASCHFKASECARMQALVSGVPKGALVMLDLYAEVFPLWQATEGFYGADFIFCMLHNFGGNIEMYGALPAVAHAPQVELCMPREYAI